MSDEGLRDFLNTVWTRLEAGAGGAPERWVSLATVNTSGGAEVRTLMMRDADRASGTVAMHTDLHSDKIAEIRANPMASVLIWNEDTQIQIRLRVRIEIASGEEVRAAWDKVPEASRGNYGTVPSPGTPITGPEAYSRQPDIARFAILTAHIVEIDAVNLGTDPHRRAVFAATDDWAGDWRAP